MSDEENRNGQCVGAWTEMQTIISLDGTKARTDRDFREIEIEMEKKERS